MQRALQELHTVQPAVRINWEGARIARLYYAASDPKGGAVEHGARVFEQEQCLHAPEVYSGMGAEEAAEILRGFFRQRR